jgi:hypothetical protein
MPSQAIRCAQSRRSQPISRKLILLKLVMTIHDGIPGASYLVERGFSFITDLRANQYGK